jgi:hypothetical protein
VHGFQKGRRLSKNFISAHRASALRVAGDRVSGRPQPAVLCSLVWSPDPRPRQRMGDWLGSSVGLFLLCKRNFGPVDLEILVHEIYELGSAVDKLQLPLVIGVESK